MHNQIKTIFVSARTEIATRPQEVVQQATPVKRRVHRRKRMRMSEALRREGIDERELAKIFAGVIERQRPKTDSDESANDKLLVGVAMNCLRCLEEDGVEAGPIPVSIQLMHQVPRPQRNLQIEEAKEGIET